MQKTLGTYKPKDASKEAPGEKKIISRIPAENKASTVRSIDQYLKAADTALPYRGNYLVTLATDSTATVGITKTRIGFFAPAAGDKLLLDQYSGDILKTEIFRDKPFNERIAGSIKALHVGNVYGTFTKILYFLACLIATSLPVTGTLIWINKMKKKKKKTFRQHSTAKQVV